MMHKKEKKNKNKKKTKIQLFLGEEFEIFIYKIIITEKVFRYINNNNNNNNSNNNNNDNLYHYYYNTRQVVTSSTVASPARPPRGWPRESPGERGSVWTQPLKGMRAALSRWAGEEPRAAGPVTLPNRLPATPARPARLAEGQPGRAGEKSCD